MARVNVVVIISTNLAQKTSSKAKGLIGAIKTFENTPESFQSKRPNAEHKTVKYLSRYFNLLTKVGQLSYAWGFA